jgi:alpha-mannosidase II
VCVCIPRWDSEKEIEDQFSNYQRLMDFMNSQPQMKINVQFATLSTYFTAVQSSSWVSAHTEEGDRAFPVLSGDFFTYSDRDDHYWSGYYTTRPFYKRMNRQLEARLRLAEILYSLCVARSLKIYPTLPDLLTSARRNLGLFQHHDGITGTAKDKVVVDYGKRMLAALEHADTIIQHSSQALLLGNDIVADSLHFSLGESRSSQDSLPKPAIVRLALDGPQTLLLINPLSSPSQRLVYVTVDTHSVLVTDNDNGTVSCQVNPVLGGDGSPSNDHYKLVFLASLPALGLVQYHLWPAAGSQSCSLSSLNSFHYSYQHPVFSEQQSLHESKDISLSTDTMTAVFSSHTGLLLSIARPGAEAVGVAMDIVMYGSRQGKHRSGAYLFLPDGAAGSLLTPDTRLRIAVTTGPVVHEVVSYVGVVSVQQRLGNIEGVEGKSVSVTTFTDIHQEMDKEVVMRLHSSISNDNGVFYTDLNGLQLVRRKTMSKLPLQGNVYPMPTMAFIQDSHHRLSVLGAQPQGVASLKQGWLEVFLDRRLSKDDERGLGQGIKDNKLTAAHFRILLETRAKPLTEVSMTTSSHVTSFPSFAPCRARLSLLTLPSCPSSRWIHFCTLPMSPSPPHNPRSYLTSLPPSLSSLAQSPVISSCSICALTSPDLNLPLFFIAVVTIVLSPLPPSGAKPPMERWS